MNNALKMKKNRRSATLIGINFWLIFCLTLFSINAQKLPDEIRGYKVHRTSVSVVNKNDADAKNKSEPTASVVVGELTVAEISLSGITLELPAEINAREHSGMVDFLMFRDFRVNGLEVEIEEYRESFKLEKNQPVVLPKPISVFVGIGQTARGALAEYQESKENWTVTGKIFVFGHFKKSFMKFKRVVPIEINILIKNPVKEIIESASKTDESKTAAPPIK